MGAWCCCMLAHWLSCAHTTKHALSSKAPANKLSRQDHMQHYNASESHTNGRSWASWCLGWARNAGDLRFRWQCRQPRHRLRCHRALLEPLCPRFRQLAPIHLGSCCCCLQSSSQVRLGVILRCSPCHLQHLISQAGSFGMVRGGSGPRWRPGVVWLGTGGGIGGRGTSFGQLGGTT